MINIEGLRICQWQASSFVVKRVFLKWIKLGVSITFMTLRDIHLDHLGTIQDKFSEELKKYHVYQEPYHQHFTVKPWVQRDIFRHTYSMKRVSDVIPFIIFFKKWKKVIFEGLKLVLSKILVRLACRVPTDLTKHFSMTFPSPFLDFPWPSLFPILHSWR